MLLTIYNLPQNTRYQDIKALLKAKCGLNELILDNLSAHTPNSKKVTVGLPEEEDAAIVVRKINGLYLEGYNLLVEPVKKKVSNTNDNMFKNQVMSSFSSSSNNMGHSMQPNEQASSMSNNQPGLLRTPGLQQLSLQKPSLQQPYYQQASFNMNNPLGFQPNNMQQNQSTPFSYGGSNNQNVFANYGYPQQVASQLTSQQVSQPFSSYKQDAPLGFGQQSSSNVWLTNNNQNTSGNASAGNSFSQQRSTRWDDPDKNSSRSSRDARSRERDRDRYTSSNSYSRDQYTRGSRRPSPGPRDYSHKRSSQGDRDYRRDSRDHPRHDRNDRNNRNRASPNKPVHVFNAPPKPSPWQSEIYGKHVTEPSLPLNPPKVPRPSRRRERPNPGPKVLAMRKIVKEKFEPIIKRARLEANAKLGIPENKKNNLVREGSEMIPSRAATWRAQLASACAKEIMKNPKNKTNVDKELVLTELKAAIRSRLATLLGTDYDMRMDAMSDLYNSQYDAKSHRDLFLQVTADIRKRLLKPKKHEATPAVSVKQEDQKPAAEVKEDSEAPPFEEPEPDTHAEEDREYPRSENTDQYKSLFKNEEAILSQLEPNLAKAIDEELDAVNEKVIEELSDEPPEKFKNLQEGIKSSALATLKQVIKVNMAKRFLNVQPVVMRIFVAPKQLSKSKLRPALEPHGVRDLMKVSSGYIGVCSTYDDLDRICKMKPLVVDGSTIVIKPYHLTGQKEKVNREAIIKQRQEISTSFTNFALQQQKLLENKQENTQESMEQADEGNEQSEENVNHGNIEFDGKTEEGNEESTVLVSTNSSVVTENNQNAEGSPKVDQDNTYEATGDQENVAEDETNQVEDSNEQVDENSQEIDGPSDNTEIDTNKWTPNVINVNNKTEETQESSTAPSEENTQVNVPEKVNEIKQEALNTTVDVAEDSDGSHDKGDVEGVKSEDIDMDRDEYDDIDMADLDEDDLEDW